MAIWQYDVDLVPLERAVERHGPLPRTLSQRDSDVDDWWEAHQPPGDLPAVIARPLPPAPSWDENLKIWGAPDGNCVEIWSEEGRVTDIRCRIDVRGRALEFVPRVVELARYCGAAILTPRRELIEPDVGPLLSSLRKSNEFAFVSDPQQYLESLDRKLSVGPDRPTEPR